jgi:carbon-monoxide dehydrogenase small subunit
MSTERYAGPTRITLKINGEERSAVISPSDTLLHTLRRTLGMTGTKLGCENGDCGACTVQVDGLPVKSCYTLTLDVIGREITTIEGLRETPIQRAFVDEYAFQCGFCTPGFVMNGHSLLAHHGHPDAETSREWLESNICRCTGYETIQKAIERAAENRAPAEE